VSEKALELENSFIREAYKYDYIIQINLTTVNGLTLKYEENQERLPIANVFLKVFNLKGLTLLIVLTLRHGWHASDEQASEENSQGSILKATRAHEEC
jgi:hypothetical protein